MEQNVPLRFFGPRSARLREVTGRDEFAVSGTSTAHAIELLSTLLQQPGVEPGAGHAVLDLVTADRDRLLAAVYARAFGDRIESTLTCTRCAQPFDLTFSLHSLIESVDARASATDLRPLADGRYESSEGLRFRLPTGRDELALTGVAADRLESVLLERCAVEGDASAQGVTWDELLERVAPLLDLDLQARCVECGHVHAIRFDIQSYLLGAFVGERRRLLTDINRLARAYSWSLEEILSLSRSDRRQFVELIESDYAA
jgi:hypothetical protein